MPWNVGEPSDTSPLSRTLSPQFAYSEHTWSLVPSRFIPGRTLITRQKMGFLIAGGLLPRSLSKQTWSGISSLLIIQKSKFMGLLGNCKFQLSPIMWSKRVQSSCTQRNKWPWKFPSQKRPTTACAMGSVLHVISFFWFQDCKQKLSEFPFFREAASPSLEWLLPNTALLFIIRQEPRDGRCQCGAQCDPCLHSFPVSTQSSEPPSDISTILSLST